jgi:hypothetical protein
LFAPPHPQGLCRQVPFLVSPLLPICLTPSVPSIVFCNGTAIIKIFVLSQIWPALCPQLPITHTISNHAAQIVNTFVHVQAGFKPSCSVPIVYTFYIFERARFMLVCNVVDYWSDFQWSGHCVFDHIRAASRWLMIIDSATWLTRIAFFIGRLGRRDLINCEFNLISFSIVKCRRSPPVVQVLLVAWIRFQRDV